jgi:hypothetical protein
MKNTTTATASARTSACDEWQETGDTDRLIPNAPATRSEADVSRLLKLLDELKPGGAS